MASGFRAHPRCGLAKAIIFRWYHNLLPLAHVTMTRYTRGSSGPAQARTVPSLPGVERGPTSMDSRPTLDVDEGLCD
jgi:hypothetical protein